MSELIVVVPVDEGAHMAIPANTGNSASWALRYEVPDSVWSGRYAFASLLESYEYLLSKEIAAEEAIRRLRILRKAYNDQRGKAGE